MVDIPDNLECLFSAQIDEEHGKYVVEVPERELTQGSLQAGGTYRIAVLSRQEPEKKSGAAPHGREVNEPPEPPVEEGERREVEIEDIGDQGDGITRVERGYVVIVNETEPGDQVTIEITDVQQNVAFAEVVE